MLFRMSCCQEIRAELYSVFCWVVHHIDGKIIFQGRLIRLRLWPSAYHTSVCKMFIVNQESLAAKSARVAVWVTFLGNLCFPKPVLYQLHGVTTVWSGLSSRSLLVKACLRAETCSLKRESEVPNVPSMLLQHWQKYQHWYSNRCLYRLRS